MPPSFLIKDLLTGSRQRTVYPFIFAVALYQRNERVNRYMILLCGYVDTQKALCYTDRTDIYLFF